MELNEYQKRAMTTCMPSCENFAYMMLNLVGEVGEFASKVAKGVRRETETIKDNELYNLSDYEEAVKADALLKAEAGDILWQLSGLCHVMGWTLDDVAAANLAKLRGRQERGTIDGEGDQR